MNRTVQLSSPCYDTIPRHSVAKTLSRNLPLGFASKRRLCFVNRGRVVDCVGRNNIKGQLPPGEKVDLPTQGESAVTGVQLEERPKPAKSHSEADYLQARHPDSVVHSHDCLTDCVIGIAADSAEWS